MSIQRAHNPMSHRADIAKRRAKRHDDIAFLKPVTIAPTRRDEVACLNLHHCKIGLRIGSEQLGTLNLPAVVESHLNFIGIAGDVVIGQNPAALAVGFHDNP